MEKINLKLQAIALGSLLLASLFFPWKPSYAETSLKSALKEAVEKAEKISEIKNNEYLSEEQREGMEIAARKEALEKILNLTILENQDLENKLSAFKNLNEKREEIKNYLLQLLQENENSYREIENRLAEIKNLEEIKQLASDFKNWRNLVYNPRTEKIIYFNLVFQGRNNVATANSRLNKIREDLNKLNGNNNFEWAENLLNKAHLKIIKAENINLSAEGLVIQEIDKGKGNWSFIKKLFSKNQIPTIKLLVEESNQNIKDAYQIFIELGKALRESNIY